VISQPQTIEQLPSSRRLRLAIFEGLLRLRPTQFAVAIKRVFGVRRCYVRLPTGALLWIDPASQFGISLLREGIYEEPMTRLFQTLLRTQDTLLDIGANEGYFSVLGCRLSPKGQVHAVEPQSRLHAVIRENARINAVGNLTLHPLALSRAEGTTRLYLRPDTNTGASSFFPKWRLGRRYEDIPTVRLDDFFDRNRLDKVRLMKLDCEGAEYLILQGATQVLAQKRIEFLSVDFHPAISGEQTSQAIDHMLRQAGYQLTSAGGQWLYHLPGLEAALAPLGPLLEVEPLSGLRPTNR
jgi:FkbM family methyltransferase